jgi:membrane associated rhomboid family serine protease
MQSGIHLPVLSYANKVIIALMGAGLVLKLVLENMFHIGFSSLLGLSVAGIKSFLVFQFVSYPLVAQGIMGTVFNGLLFWFLGSELERIWGVRRYLIFLVVSAVGGGIFYLLIVNFFYAGAQAVPYTGMMGVASALCVAYSILFPNQIFTMMFLFPIKAKYFCWIIIGIELLMGATSSFGGVSWANLGTMLSGFLCLIYMARATKLAREFSENRQERSRAQRVKKGHLSIVTEDDDDENKNGPKGPKYWQ